MRPGERSLLYWIAVSLEDNGALEAPALKKINGPTDVEPALRSLCIYRWVTTQGVRPDDPWDLVVNGDDISQIASATTGMVKFLLLSENSQWAGENVPTFGEMARALINMTA